MFRNSILAGFMVLAFTAMAYVGCSSSDGGDGDAPKAMSLNGDTSVAATGGAAIAVDYALGFASVISSALSALAIDGAPESSSASLKFLDDLDLGICTGGTALLTGPGTGGSGGSGGSGDGPAEAVLTLTNCTGSPLSSTAVNGRLVLTIEEDDFDVNPISMTLGYSMTGSAELAGLTDDEGDVFTIGSNTVLTGSSAMGADLLISAAGLKLMTAELTFGAEEPTDRITVTEGEGSSERTLEFACFDVSISLTVEPPSVDAFSANGVLNLDGQVYTVTSSDDITFGTSPSGVAAPTSGSMTLTSGDTVSSDGSCFEGVDPGDTSIATAFFGSDGRVLIYAKAPGPECFECFQFWEDLLKTLTEAANPQCPSTSCGGTGGTAGSGGTGGSGGSVAANYCVDYDLFSTSCFPEPEFGNNALVEIQGSSVTYIMTVGGLPEAGPEYLFDVDATGTLDGASAAGTGDFVQGTASSTCMAPEARLSFDIEFLDEARATYAGTINFDFTLDAACGSSICFASASVTGGPCN